MLDLEIATNMATTTPPVPTPEQGPLSCSGLVVGGLCSVETALRPQAFGYGWAPKVRK